MVVSGGIHWRMWNRAGSWSGSCGIWSNTRWDQVLDSEERWGPEWGENGYMRMERGVADEGGHCGIAMEASYPIKSSSTKSSNKDEL